MTEPRELNVLLVEDSPEDAELLHQVFRRIVTAHVNVVQCVNLAEAISLIQKEKFDVVLLDLSLPDSWGMMGVSRIFNIAPEMPIVVLTGMDDSAVEIRALLEGAQDYLIKGAINSDQVFRSIRYAIQRKKAEEALRQSEKWFHTLAELSPVGSFRTEPEGNCLYVSESWCTMTGLKREQALGQHWTLMIHQEDRQRILENWYKAIEEKKPCKMEFRFQRPDEKSIYVFGEATRVLDDRGGILGHIGTFTDITERKHAENLQSALYEELRKSEQKYRTLFEESRDVVFISTPEGRFLDINTAGLILFGYSSKEELLSMDIVKDLFVYPEERPVYEETMIKDGFVKDFELILKRKNGTKLVVLETSVAELDEQGKAISYRGIMRDVTHVKDLQHQLIQFQKMETIGRLAGGVAHDFNNILMAIMSYCDLSLSAGLNASIAKNLGEIKKQAETGAALTRQLLAFSRKQVLVPKVIDLNRVLTEMEPMIRRLLREDIAIVLNLDATLGKIQADPYQIEQVVMNLVVNAKDAMPDGGRLTIRTSVQEFHTGSQLEDVPIEQGRYIKLAVTDNGLGMDDLTRLKIFEPFFTTKEVGNGSGLGLPSVYGIIKQSGGYIFVSSQPNSGSTFTIYLPELPGCH